MLDLPDEVSAPVRAGETLGTLTVSREGETLLTIPVVAGGDVTRLTWGQTTARMLRMAIFCG